MSLEPRLLASKLFTNGLYPSSISASDAESTFWASVKAATNIGLPFSGSGDTVGRRVVLDESEESCAVGTAAVDSGRVVVDELFEEDLHEVKQIAATHENTKRIDTTGIVVANIIRDPKPFMNFHKNYPRNLTE
jgi:hypothetical protein